MMLLALFLCCLVAGSFACGDEDRCKDPSLAEEILEVKLMPNEQQLRSMCPRAISFLECLKENLECSGHSLHELTASVDRGTVIKAQILLAALNFVRDICDEDSSFHRDYLANIDCVRDFVDNIHNRCQEALPEVLDEFFGKRYADESERNHAEILCLRTALEVGCIVDQIGKTCGADAHSTVLTGLGKFKSVLKTEACQELENDAESKAQLLEFLELSDERSSNMQKVFDLIK